MHVLARALERVGIRASALAVTRVSWFDGSAYHQFINNCGHEQVDPAAMQGVYVTVQGSTGSGLAFARVVFNNVVMAASSYAQVGQGQEVDLWVPIKPDPASQGGFWYVEAFDGDSNNLLECSFIVPSSSQAPAPQPTPAPSPSPSPSPGSPPPPAAGSYAQVVSVAVNGVGVPRNGTAYVAPGQDAQVAITFRNASTGTVRERAWLTNIGPGCSRTQPGCFASPDDPGEDGNGGKTLAAGQQTGEVCHVITQGATLQLQAEAQWEDGQGQYHLDGTWPFTLAPTPGAPPSQGPPSSPPPPATSPGSYAQVVSVAVNGVGVPRNGTAYVAPGQDAQVAITFRNASAGTVRERAWLTNVGSGCSRTQPGCFASPDDPGEDGNGGKTLAAGQQTGEVIHAVTQGATLQLQAEAQWEDGQGQYHLDGTWPFTLAPTQGPGSAPPPPGVIGGPGGGTGAGCVKSATLALPNVPTRALLVRGNQCAGPGAYKAKLVTPRGPIEVTFTVDKAGAFQASVPFPPHIVSAVTLDATSGAGWANGSLHVEARALTGRVVQAQAATPGLLARVTDLFNGPARKGCGGGFGARCGPCAAAAAQGLKGCGGCGGKCKGCPGAGASAPAGAGRVF